MLTARNANIGRVYEPLLEPHCAGSLRCTYNFHTYSENCSQHWMLITLDSDREYCCPPHLAVCLHHLKHLKQRTEYKVSLLIYKCLHQAAPLYLTEMCVPVSAIQLRHGLRSALRGDLEVPRCNLARYGQRSFNVSGPSLWNSLPLTVRDSSRTLTQFCTRLKTSLFTRAYGTSS